MHKPLYSIGDSHSGTFHPWAKQIHIGPETIHSFASGKSDHTFKSFLETGFLKEEGIWIYTLGEIDIRCHVHKQIHEKGRNEDDVICDLANRYLDKIIDMHKSNPNYEIAVMSVVPPMQYDFRKEEVDKDPAFAIYAVRGADKERCRYTQKLNKLLDAYTFSEGILYLDIYKLYKDENDMLPLDISDGNVHILNRGKVELYLKELNLIP